MIEDIDISILREFDKLEEEEESTTWKIMRKIFPRGLNKEDELIKRHINKMEQMGLFFIEKNSPKKFTMIIDNVKFKRMKFENENFNALAVKIDCKWEIYQL